MLENLAKAIARSRMPYNQKVACLCQAGIECGIFNNPSKLARDHLNFWGLKWRNEMSLYAQPVLYKAHDGEEQYCKFQSFEAAVRGYEAFIKRAPYNGYERYLFRIDSYLTFIGPIFCPPGFTDEWAIKHEDLFYDEYVTQKFGGESIELIDKYQNTEPEPILVPGRLKILLDPGHSMSDPGAMSPNKKVKEYALNLAQAEHIQKELTEHQVDIYDPNPDDLRDVGRSAAGYDIFISVHHNSYSGTSEPGVEAFTTRDAMEVCKRFAASVSARIAQALKIPDRGHKEAGYTVINEATKHCKMSVLVESHFITDEHTYSIALAKSLRASTEIIEAIRMYAKTVEPGPGEEMPTLRKGDKGSAVALLQQELNDHGANLKVDGDFGVRTYAAVIDFQEKFLLEVDGIVGPETWKALLSDPEPTPGISLRLRLAHIAEGHALKYYRESNDTYNYFRKQFFKVLGSKNWPWCGAFVHTCLCEAVGKELSINPGTGPATFALVETWQKWAEKKGYLKDPRTYTPVKGDIVLFDWQGATYPDRDYENHIGVYLKRSGQAYLCAEGNYKNSTAIVKRYLKNIQWFIRLPDDMKDI